MDAIYLYMCIYLYIYNTGRKNLCFLLNAWLLSYNFTDVGKIRINYRVSTGLRRNHVTKAVTLTAKSI